MIRTLLKDGKQDISKLALRPETVRVLGDTALTVIVGGHDPNCTAETQPASGCAARQNGADTLDPKK